MIQVISKTLDYKTGLTGSEVLTGTALKYGAYQGFICQTYTVVAIVTNSKGDDITDLLGLRGVTLSPGIYICVPKGESIYSISLASGSVVLYGIAANIERVPTIAEIIDAFSSRVTTDGGTLESTSCINGSLVPYYKDASFVLIPSGYKALKAYAQKPITGNGDLTWSRNSVANRTQSNGNIGSVAANVPRLSYMYGSCPALLLEPQRTNLALWSEQFDNASWSKTASSVTANSTTSPSGVVDADTLTADGTSSRHDTFFAPSVTSGTNYTYSVYAKKGTNDFLQLSTGGGFGSNAFANFDLNTGVIGTIGSAATATITALGNGWYRCTMTAPATITGGTGIYNLIVTSSTASRLESNTLTTSVFLWGAQFEAGAYPTTYIPTTNATATRLVDTFTRNNIYTNGLISASGGTWYVELRNNVAYTRDTPARTIILSDDTIGSNCFTIRNAGGGSARLTIAKVIASTNTNLYTTLTDTVKIAIKWNGTSADVFVNGTKQVSATAFTTTAMQFLNGIGTDVPTFIQAMALYPTPLSDATCIAMTQ